ncbi:MAG: hypothetical protein WB341_13770 [Terracidiphilus sp.]
MSAFQLFGTPWWANLLILIPVVPYLLSRREKIRIGKKRLLAAALFGMAFGFVEAAVVVYLRVATGLWPGPQAKALVTFPESLLRIESFREVATIIMLGGIALLAGQSIKARVVAFLWTFAVWDIFYYVWLRLTIGWPTSLMSSDVLFLIPAPWVAQVWFPLLVSSLTAAVIWFRS